MDLLKSLNPQQCEAVTATDGPILVLAGAGSGKTRVITYRIAYLINKYGVRPGQILAVTFTNKAATEMKERISQLLTIDLFKDEPFVSTFHSFCVRLLRRNLGRLGGSYTGDFTIYDTDDQLKVIKTCMKDLNIDEKMIQSRSVQSNISRTKNQDQTAEDLLMSKDPQKVAIGKIFNLYEQRLSKNNALDFDDLLLKSVKIMRQFPEVQEYYNRLFQYVLIDEYQDTNPPQYSLIRLLTQSHQNICVVGDPDQSIYRFRAADIRNILDFEKHYPGAKLVNLTENYRSTRNILSVANQIIKNNTQRKEKELFTNNEEGDKIRYYQAVSGEDEADFVAKEIRRWQQAHPFSDKCQVAVLYRTNAQSRLFEEACRRVGLKYLLVGGFSFYQRAEIKDIVAYLKLVLNFHDSVAFERVVNTPVRGIGKTTLDVLYGESKRQGISHWNAVNLVAKSESLSARAANSLKGFCDLISMLAAQVTELSLSELVKAVVTKTGYVKSLQEENTEEAEMRLLNLEELVNAAAEAELRGETLRDFIDHASLVADTDSMKDDAEVTLMTIHSAKGLEFPLVFIVGLEENIFPHQRSINNLSEIEEERRLCYVAFTRAQSRLYLTHAEWRRHYGEETCNPPSRFLQELPLEKLEDLSYRQSWYRSRSEQGISDIQKTAYNGSSYDKAPSMWPNAKENKSFSSHINRSAFIKRQNDRNEVVPKKSTPMMSGFSSGSRVRHEKYGTGLVMKEEGDKIVINFPGYGPKKFVANLVKLEKI